jgi:hypothetical protein
LFKPGYLFDAIVGRLILQFVPRPSRQCARWLRF